jgi:hypothetical protein
MQQPMRAFPSWFLRIVCDRSGKVVIINEAYAATKLRGRTLAEILAPYAMTAAAASLPRPSC